MLSHERHRDELATSLRPTSQTSTMATGQRAAGQRLVRDAWHDSHPVQCTQAQPTMPHGDFLFGQSLVSWCFRSANRMLAPHPRVQLTWRWWHTRSCASLNCRLMRTRQPAGQ